MLLRKWIQVPDQRTLLGVIGLLAGVLLQSVGSRLLELGGRSFWAGFCDGFTVVVLAVSIFWSVSGSRALARRS